MLKIGLCFHVVKITVAFIAIGLISACGNMVGKEGNGTNSSFQSVKPEIRETVRIAADYQINLSDPRRLAGFADSIFVGRVLKSLTSENPKTRIPETLNTVEIIYSLKHSSESNRVGRIAVIQEGGVSAKGTLVLIGEDRIVEVGNYYLFATTKNNSGELTLIPVYGDSPIPGTDIASLKDSTGTASKIINQMKNAIAHQIPYNK